jgi:hypothetical protein
MLHSCDYMRCRRGNPRSRLRPLAVTSCCTEKVVAAVVNQRRNRSTALLLRTRASRSSSRSPKRPSTSPRADANEDRRKPAGENKPALVRQLKAPALGLGRGLREGSAEAEAAQATQPVDPNWGTRRLSKCRHSRRSPPRQGRVSSHRARDASGLERTSRLSTDFPIAAFGAARGHRSRLVLSSGTTGAAARARPSVASREAAGAR